MAEAMTAPVADSTGVAAPGLARRNGLVVFGAGIVVAMVLLAIFAGVVAPYDPTDMKVSDALKRPSLAHPFGTDRFGRDVLSRTIHGSRIALGVALSSIGLALVVGTILGLAGGYVGGATDLVIGRAMDVLFSFPTLILAIGIAAMLGPGLDNAALTIAVVYAPLFSRVVRGPVIAERAKEYAVAALGLGAGSFRVVLRHILPNVLAPLIVATTLSVGDVILLESVLSFLGLGIQPPLASWGTMLSNAQEMIAGAPLLAIYPGLMIFLTVIACNLLGDALNQRLDRRASIRI